MMTQFQKEISFFVVLLGFFLGCSVFVEIARTGQDARGSGQSVRKVQVDDSFKVFCKQGYPGERW